MGLYLNPDNRTFADLVSSDIYVDKTGLIAYMNSRIGKAKRLVASSRPRRFGKTLAADMLAAYYSRGCDSKELFSAFEISKDASFEKYLNQYDVISLDIQAMNSIVKDANLSDAGLELLPYISSQVIVELREAYPDIVKPEENSLAVALAEINRKTGNQFVIIIDEWDCVFREEKENTVLQEAYINFLRSLFKGSLSDRFVKLGYITGILPIKKYGTQSALNNFRELTMIAPGGIAEYIGFTEEEVKVLCEQQNIPFELMQRWYDGYIFERENVSFYIDMWNGVVSDGVEDSRNAVVSETIRYGNKDVFLHVYSPNSVMEAIDNRSFQNYWSRTETFEFLKMYIEMDFDGLRGKVVELLGGARCRIEVESFQNDMTSMDCADDVLTMLIHLGYLAYDGRTQEVFIPNEEVRSTFVLAVRSKNWDEVYKAIRESEKLLKATLAMDGDAVAEMIQKVHMKNASCLEYNNEISLASVIRVAYYSALKDYVVVREMPAGEGFADMAFIPRRRSMKPALLVELKWDKSVKGALDQIKDKKYIEGLEEYKDNLLLVGINYDKKTKKHQCVIENGI